MPHVATSIAELLGFLAGIAHVDGDRLVIDDDAAFRAAASATSPGPPPSAADDADARGRPLGRVGGGPGAGRPLGVDPGPVHGPRPGRGPRLHRAGHQHPRPDLRHGARDVRDRRSRSTPARSCSSWPGASGLHLPAPDRVRDQRPRRRDRGRLARARCSSRATTTSSTPRSTPPIPEARPRRSARLTQGDRGRLLQHRHRHLDAGGPVASRTRRAAAAELTRAARAHRAHPRARGRRHHGCVGGEIGEVGKQNSTVRGARGVHGRLPARDRGARARRAAACPRWRPDRHLARRRAAAGRRRRRGEARLRRAGEASARSRAKYGLAGAVQHGASTLPDELFDRFPEVETAEIHLATGFQNMLFDHPAFPAELKARSTPGAAELRRRAQGRTRRTSSSSTRPARRRIGPFKRRSGTCRPRTRSSPRRAPSSPSCSSSST